MAVCFRCGAQNPDDTRFCFRCGARLDGGTANPNRNQYSGPQYNDPQYNNPQYGDPRYNARYNPQYNDPRYAQSNMGYTQARRGAPNRKLTFIIAGAGAAIAAAIIVAVLVFGSYKRVVGKYISSVFDADGAGLLDTYPDPVVSVLCRNSGESERDLATDLSDALDSSRALIYDYYDDVDYSYTITDTYDYTRSEVRSLQSQYDYSDIDFNITGAKRVYIDMSVVFNNDVSDPLTTDMTLVVITSGFGWYIDVLGSDLDF